MIKATLAQTVVQNQQMELIVNSNVKGITRLKKVTIQDFSDTITDMYAKDCQDDGYQLHVEDLPDFIQQEFASLILSIAHDLASESTGPDNEYFDKKMLPSLIKYLRDISNKDLEIDFITSWRDGVTRYLHNQMQMYIDRSLGDLNTKDNHINKFGYQF